MVLTQIIANSVIIGSIYALVASGFAIIYSTNRFIHLAHGAVVALGAYLLYTFYSILQLPFPLAGILTLVSTGIAGVLMVWLLYSPLQKKKSSNVILLIASVGLLLLIENVFLLLFGANVRTIGYIAIAPGLEILGALVTPIQIVIIIVTVILFIILYALMKYTKLGRMMRAVADNKELASVCGLNVKKITYVSFMIGSILAGGAGMLVGLEQSIQPNMGTSLIIRGFTGAIIGGATSVPGAILGGYLLGFAENVGIWFLPSGYKDAIAFTLLFIFLLARPSGILGLNKGVRS
ncbi:MAG TPA: branched-chain amino acid ABC transporter permease [Candidatus Nanoarchaeia archaeon]|nr:branched-chain amino acid ABC transporter permease [Candidatus Nanoarchaeia archaeon]